MLQAVALNEAKSKIVGEALKLTVLEGLMVSYSALPILSDGD
mgnify:CR=1 FL=1